MKRSIVIALVTALLLLVPTNLRANDEQLKDCEDALAKCEVTVRDLKVVVEDKDKEITELKNYGKDLEERLQLKPHIIPTAIELALCIGVGGGVGYLGGNTLLGIASAGTACTLLFPF